MGFLDHLFGRLGSGPSPTATQPSPAVPKVHSRPTVLLSSENYEIVAAVGESFHQEELRAICGSVRWEDVRHPTMAGLMLEPDNPYDSRAIAVWADVVECGVKVGHLSRGDALDWHPILSRTAAIGRMVACEALICGRGPGTETSNLGIFLHLPPLEEAAQDLAEYEHEGPGEPPV